jgi:hypothetical protein
MRRISIVAVIALFVLAVAGQLIAPRIASRQIEKRLTKQGGTAHAEVHAIPWPRLLFGEGHSVKVRAQGIDLPLISPSSKVLQDLDGFDHVDIEVTGATAGPFELASVTLHRDGGDRPYQAAVTGSITAQDLATFSGSQIGGTLGGFLSGLAGGGLPFGNQPLPIDLQAVLRSEGGRPRAVTAQGTVAGFPAGPLVEALAQALAGRF